MNRSIHPSFLQLDEFVLAQAGDPASRSSSEAADPSAVRAHLEQCNACREHVARVQERAEMPGWVHALAMGGPAALPEDRSAALPHTAALFFPGRPLLLCYYFPCSYS